MDSNVRYIVEAKKKGKDFTILHQGRILYLYNFHLALCPPRMISVQNMTKSHSPAIATANPDISPPRLPELGSSSKKNKKCVCH